MIAWGIRKVFIVWIGLLMVTAGSLKAIGEDEIWLAASLAEIKTASPMLGQATMTLSLAKAIVNAVPVKYQNETKESGFDIAAIAQAVEAMKINDLFDVTINNTHLTIRKYTKPKPEVPPSSSTLRINNPSLKLPVPLFLTGTAVTLLQFVVKEFKGMDDQLTKLIEQVKQSPPGLVLKGEDRLMNSWLEIILE